jgi:hypothetical protein
MWMNFWDSNDAGAFASKILCICGDLEGSSFTKGVGSLIELFVELLGFPKFDRNYRMCELDYIC